MAKFSISVPDPEWEQARAVGGDLNASQLVQAALRQFVESRKTKPLFAHRPQDAEPLVEEAREELAIEARRAFENGYRAGARGARRIGWSAIELLADFNDWDYGKWLRALRESHENLGLYADAYAYFEEEFEETMYGSVWQQGFTDALRDIWRAVAQGTEPPVGDANLQGTVE